MRITFDTNREFFQFIGAKEFHTKQPKQEFAYQKNVFEKLGGLLAAPVFGVADLAGRNIRNPVVIVAATLAALAVITFAFYPVHVVAAVAFVLPQIFYIKSWMVYGAIHAIASMTLWGASIRALGRMSNQQLVQAWNAKNLVPVALGSEIVKV